MRLLDLGLSAERGLRELPYPAYLLAMAVIVRRLTEVYADVLSEEGRLLAGKTAAAAKTAYLSGTPARDDALRLHQRWTELIGDPDDPRNPIDGPLGTFCAMYTFDMLAGELAGKMVRRAALAHVTNAAKELPDPRTPSPEKPRRTIVQLAATASRAALRAVACDRLRRPRTRQPLAWFGSDEEDGRE